MTISPTMLTLIDHVSKALIQSLTTIVESGLKSNPDELSGNAVSEVTDVLVQSLNEAGRAGMKAYIEQFEDTEDEIERDGKTFRIKDEPSTKSFLTLFGEIHIDRRYYHNYRGGPGIVPLDEKWDMQKRYATPEVVERALWASALLTPKEVAEMFGKMCAFNPSVACVQDMINSDGKKIAKLLEDPEQSVLCRQIEVPEQTEIFVGSLDGANVLLREKGKKRGRPTQRPGGDQKTDPKNETPSSYKNAMVGSFSFYRREEAVIDIETGLEGFMPDRLSSIYCGRMPEDRAVRFKVEFEAINREITNQLKKPDETIKIMLLDGARPLWNYVENNPCFEDYYLLIDFYHSTEHLSLAAKALFGNDTKEAKKWHKKWRHKLKYEEGAPAGILRSIEYHRGRNRLSKGRNTDLDKEVTFFKRNKTRMNYAEHVANGWPIGSGPVEAACKTIVKARLCQSGMRWTREGGQDVLGLRVLVKSEQWNNAWNHYHSQQWSVAA